MRCLAKFVVGEPLLIIFVIALAVQRLMEFRKLPVARQANAKRLPNPILFH